MIDAFEANKQTDENIQKLVEKIMSDIGKRKSGNRLFDDIETCFCISNANFYFKLDLEIHKIEASKLLKNLQDEILNILPTNGILIKKPILVGVTGYNL
jgi:hypothetical protein